MENGNILKDGGSGPLEVEKVPASSELSEAEKVLGSLPTSFKDFRREVEKENIDSGLGKIAEKYGYGEELKEMLEVAIPKIAEYYDDSETVLKALDSCPIFMVEAGKNSSEVADEYFGTSEQLPTRASGGASVIPKIMEDGQIEVKRGIFLRSNYKNGLQTLVHEVCHQVASVDKKPSLESDGRIRIDIGLSSEYYAQDEGGEAKMVESKREFLEEMANAYDTEMIMKSIEGDEFKSSEYGVLRDIAYRCPVDVISKLKQLRVRGNYAESPVKQEGLERASQAMDGIMNVPRKIFLSRRMAGGDAEKARIIQREMDQRNFDEAVKSLTLWGERA